MNVIANMFVFKEDYGASTQMKQEDAGKRYAIYMQNMIVALVSAKLANPEDEVLLVATSEPPAEYAELMKRYDIRLAIVPYDKKYRTEKQYTWSLIFYRFSVLDYLISCEQYERVCLLDMDTVTMRSFKELWQEADYGMMLYPVGHSYEHHERDLIREFYAELKNGTTAIAARCRDGLPLVHYGGEFFCGNRRALGEFTEYAKEVYLSFQEQGLPENTNFNDEHVFSIAAALYKSEGHPVIEAQAYLYRYWTEKKFYLISTNTVYNPVCIWHLPGEKDKGMLLLYRYFIRHGAFPPVKKAARMLGIAQAKRPYPLYTLYAQYVRRRAGKK